MSLVFLQRASNIACRKQPSLEVRRVEKMLQKLSIDRRNALENRMVQPKTTNAVIVRNEPPRRHQHPRVFEKK